MADTRLVKKSLNGIQGGVDRLPRSIPVPASKSTSFYRWSYQRPTSKSYHKVLQSSAEGEPFKTVHPQVTKFITRGQHILLWAVSARLAPQAAVDHFVTSKAARAMADAAKAVKAYWRCEVLRNLVSFSSTIEVDLRKYASVTQNNRVVHVQKEDAVQLG
jgi:hypothetical protein